MTINRYILSSEFCESVRDGTHDTPKRTNSGYRLVTSKHIKNGQINSDEGYFISVEDFNKINERSLVEQWDVLMSMIGTIGEAAIVKDQPKYAIKNVALFKCGDELKAKWLYYFLCSPEGKGQLFSNQKGASQQFISLTQLRNLQIPIRDQSTMKKITDILSAYDDLIENNQKQIKLLEEAAMRLYKEWFVKLRFPGHENTKIVDGVPEGWEKLYIEDVCQTVGGGTPSTKVPSYYNNGTIPWVTPTDITRNDCLILLDTEKKITEEGLARSSAKMLPSETILMTSRASVGFFGISEQEVCTNQGFISCIPNNKNLMMFLLLNLMSRKDEIRQKAGGATYLEINKSTFRKLIVIKPDDTLLNEFQSITYTILKRISALKKQSDLLKQARDKLLPKLMNGDIEV